MRIRMITVGVQTKGLLPEKNTDEAFKMIHDAGFDCVDINIDTFLRVARNFTVVNIGIKPANVFKLIIFCAIFFGGNCAHGKGLKR